MTTYHVLSSILREIANAAAMGAAYTNWSDGDARKEVREAWEDVRSPLREPRGQRVTVADLKTLTEDQRQSLGFGNWDESLVVIPLWAFNYIADGETLACIDDTEAVKGRDNIDLDVRFGCIAYGFRP